MEVSQSLWDMMRVMMEHIAEPAQFNLVCAKLLIIFFKFISSYKIYHAIAKTKLKEIFLWIIMNRKPGSLQMALVVLGQKLLECTILNQLQEVDSVYFKFFFATRVAPHLRESLISKPD